MLQHYSPPGARINTQIDGDEESVFVAVVGVVRTTGTFSFTSGYATYMTMVAPLVFGFLGARKRNDSSSSCSRSRSSWPSPPARW